MRKVLIRAAGAGAIIMAMAFAGFGVTDAHPAQNQSAPAPAQPQAVTLAALGGLERGDWELKLRGEKGEVRHVCVGDPRLLLQVRHGVGSCSRFVVTDEDKHAVVTYDCAGAGNGRTDLRVETPRLVQIQSQGIADSAPFSLTMEGRRVGSCK